jgi:uncharacterized membrane protein
MKTSLPKYLLFAILFVFSFTAGAYNNPVPDKKAPTAEQELRITEIKLRVDEIKALDKSQLTKEERKELRKELTAIKKEARRISGGVYFSAGAILVLVIVLLLVL